MPAEAPSEDGEARYRFSVAPRFACDPRWEERLSGGRGVRREGGRLLARGDFAPLGAALLDALLAGGAPGPDAALPPTHLGLVAIPTRLRQLFWTEAEKRRGCGMDRLFSELDSFLRFKGLPLPPRAAFEVCVSAPGLPSTRTGEGGLRFGDGPAAVPRPSVGLLNFGDEASFVVLLPIPPVSLAARLAARGEPSPRALGPSELVDRFFDCFPDEPLVGVRLDPGEGL